MLQRDTREGVPLFLSKVLVDKKTNLTGEVQPFMETLTHVYTNQLEK